MTRKSKMRRARAAHPMASPVGRTMLANAVRKDMNDILTAAQLHAWTGASPPRLLNNAGRLVYVALGAARSAGMTTESPDIRIALGMSEALGDLQADGDIERHRPAIQSGLLAIERLLPGLEPIDMLEAAIELDGLLARAAGMGTSDIQKLFPATAPQ